MWFINYQLTIYVMQYECIDFSLDRLSSVKMPLLIINLLIVEIISKVLVNCLTINKSFALIP